MAEVSCLSGSSCGSGSSPKLNINLSAALATGVLTAATLGAGTAVTAAAGTEGEIAAEAAWGWATSSADMAAGALFCDGSR